MHSKTFHHRDRSRATARVDALSRSPKARFGAVSCIALFAAISGAPGFALAADDAPAAAAATDVSDTTDVSEIIVRAKKNDPYDVLPDRATGSVFGTNLTLAETPRSVTLIEAPLISLYGIRTVNDFVNVTPGAFTGNYFGVPGALDVRGERADNFFRGFRRIENRGNFPTSVTAADYVEIIKGAPPIVYGGGKVGGILNFVPKGPTHKDGSLITVPTGLASATLGTYGKRSADLEAGTPFEIAGMPSGVYVALQGEDSDSFYHNIYLKNLLLQVAAKTEVNDKLSVEYGGMGQWSDLNQSLGWNRLTQDLINSDGKHYLAGSPQLNLDTNHDGILQPVELDPYSLTQFAFANPFPYGALTANQQAAMALDPSTVHLTALDHRTVQAENIDFSKSTVFTGYFDIKYDLSESWNIKNQVFYDNMGHEKYSSYGFTANYQDYAFEDKITLAGQFDPTSFMSISTTAGGSWRKSGGREREARTLYQVLDRRDISVGATGNDRFEGAWDGTGNVPYNWDEKGSYTDLGGFFVGQATLFDRITAIAGGRVDRYGVTVHGTDTSGVYGDAKDSTTSWSYNLSLSAKLTPLVNVYATYATSNYLELGQGGIVGFPNVFSNNWVQPSKLFEAGLKGYLDNGKLYFNFVYYNQSKTSFDSQAGTFDHYISKGEELEAHYALTKRLSFTGAATFQTTKLLNAPFFLGVPPAVLGLDPTLTYGGRFIGVGSMIGFPGPVDVPAPKQVFSLNGTYTSPHGWGVSLGANHVSSMFAGYSQTVRLPAYTVARAAAFYNWGKWGLQVNVNNVLDAHYFNPQFLFWDSFVSPSIGRTAEVTLRRNF